MNGAQQAALAVAISREFAGSIVPAKNCLATENASMTKLVEELLIIDIRFRFVIFGLECALSVPFSGAECERVFRDASENQVSSKHYKFFESSRLPVAGRVDEYEPELICLLAI